MDCTVVITREYNDAIATALLNLQIQWNMPIDYTTAPALNCDAAIKMVELQSSMAEQATPQDRKSQPN